MKGDLESKDIVELMQETFRFVAEFEGEVPASPLKTAVTVCSTTCLWPNGNLHATCMKYSKK